MRITRLPFSVAAGLALLTMSALAEDQKSEAITRIDKASKAWGECHQYAIEKNLRAFGATLSDESIVDLAFADCFDLENVLKRASLDAVQDKDSIEIAFSNFKIETHRTLVEYAAALRRQAQ